MIYTITFSPSLDYTMEVENLKVGEINRSKKENYVAGGKGINVSVMLKILGQDSVAMGFVGGFIGEYIKDFLRKKQVETDFVEVLGNSRINIKICGKQETAINGNGAEISMDKINELLKKTMKFKEDDYLVISGNVPSSLPMYIYELLLSYIRVPNMKIVVDCENLLLKNTLKYKPFLIKPNKQELEDLFNEKFDSLDKIKEKCHILQSWGARNIIVSLGKEGAFMLTETNEEILQKAPGIDLISSVGAGDCLVAGFIYEYEKTHSYASALKYGVACGSACSACSYLSPSKEDVDKLLLKM